MFRLENVKQLLSEGVDINKTDEYGVNSFWIAAFNNQLEVMRELKAQGIDMLSVN